MCVSKSTRYYKKQEPIFDLVLRHDLLNEVYETVVPGLSGTDYQASYGDGPYDFVWFKYDKMNVRPVSATAAKPKKPPKGSAVTTTSTGSGSLIKSQMVIFFFLGAIHVFLSCKCRHNVGIRCILQRIIAMALNLYCSADP